MTQSPRKPPELAPALILFGNDDASRPQAGWFIETELLAAERASAAIGYASVRVTTDEECDLALRLPRGRLVGRQVHIPLLSPELVPVLRLLVVGNRLVRLRPIHARTHTSDPLSPAE